MTLRCDHATNFEKENKIVLNGNIVITDPTFSIYGDSVDQQSHSFDLAAGNRPEKGRLVLKISRINLSTSRQEYLGDFNMSLVTRPK